MISRRAVAQRDRVMHRRQVWEGGPVICSCCNLPSELVSEGAVLRSLRREARVRMDREEIGSLLQPVWQLSQRAGLARGMVCPQCKRKRGVPETRLHFLDVEGAGRLGPMCLECVTSSVESMNVDRAVCDLPVWIVRCSGAALEMMKKIDFGKLQPSGIARSLRSFDELLY